MNRRWRLLFAGMVLTCASGCATVLSTRQHSPVPPDRGLAYWLPKRDIQVTITFTKGSLTSVSSAPTAAYADLTKGYVASYSRNFIGENDLTVKVNTQGLLDTDSTTKTTIELDALAQAFVQAARPAQQPAKAPPFECRSDDTQDDVSLAVRFQTSETPGLEDSAPRKISGTNCYVKVSLKPAGQKPANRTNWDDEKWGRSGFFYRDNEPYLIETDLSTSTDFAEAATLKFQDVAALPNWAETRFLPLPRALFASNSSGVTFMEGVPTTWSPSTDGEAIALFKVPADVLKAYFGAVGSIFSARQTSLSDQASYLKQYQSVLLQQQALAACKAALATNDYTKINAACSQTGG